MMSMAGWAARWLREEDRDIALGDLEEAGAGGWVSVREVMGLVMRQNAGLWLGWRPWAAGGVALPGSLLLLGVSFGLSLHVRNGRRGGGELLVEGLLMLAWAWSSGFVVGSISRPTRWMSAMLCGAPCLACVLRFQDTSVSRLCVLLFVVPAVMGARAGLHGRRLPWGLAMGLAGAVTVLMGLSHMVYLRNWLFLVPVWMVAAMGWFGMGMERECAG